MPCGAEANAPRCFTRAHAEMADVEPSHQRRACLQLRCSRRQCLRALEHDPTWRARGSLLHRCKHTSYGECTRAALCLASIRACRIARAWLAAKRPAAALWWRSGASALLDSGTAARAMRQLPNTVGAAARMLCRSLRLMRAAKAPPHLVEPAVASAAAPAAGGARSSPTAHPGAEEYRPRCWTGSARCEILGALPAGANRASLVRGKLRLRVRRCARARTPARHRSTCGACGASSVAGKERAPRWSCLDTAARGQRRWRSRREQEFCRAVFVVGRVQ